MSKIRSNDSGSVERPGIGAVHHGDSSYKWLVLTVVMVILDSNIVNGALPDFRRGTTVNGPGDRRYVPLRLHDNDAVHHTDTLSPNSTKNGESKSDSFRIN